jgi:hypothetical protein
MAKAKKLTDASKANQSGIKLEKELKSFLREKKIPFIYQKNGKHEIDFIIGKDIHADCTNQNVTGSVDEKIPHKIWKYYKKYEYKDVYIIRGKHIPSESVLTHCNEIADYKGFKFHLMTLEEFCNFLEGKETKSGIDNFIVQKEE